MISSGPFRGLFLFLGTAEFLHLIATRGASPQGPKKRLEFCEISHERGARSPANAPGIGLPLPTAHPRAGGGAAAQPPAGRRGGAGRATRAHPRQGGCPGVARRHSRPRARWATPGGDARPVRGTCGAATPGRPPARAGRLPGKTGRFPGRTARLAGRATGRGGYPGGIYRLCRGSYRAGRGRAAGYPRGGAAAQLPPGGRYPRRLPPAQLAELCSEL